MHACFLPFSASHSWQEGYGGTRWEGLPPSLFSFSRVEQTGRVVCYGVGCQLGSWAPPTGFPLLSSHLGWLAGGVY